MFLSPGSRAGQRRNGVVAAKVSRISTQGAASGDRNIISGVMGTDYVLNYDSHGMWDDQQKCLVIPPGVSWARIELSIRVNSTSGNKGIRLRSTLPTGTGRDLYFEDWITSTNYMGGVFAGPVFPGEKIRPEAWTASSISVERGNTTTAPFAGDSWSFCAVECQA